MFKTTTQAKYTSCVLDLWLEKKLPVCTENASVDFKTRLYAEQWRRLCATLEYAKNNSSYYSKSLAHILPKEFTAKDLHSLPCITAQDLQHWEQFLCTSLGNIERMVSLQTSGTTGNAKRIAFSEQDLAATVDFFGVGMSQLLAAQQKLLALWPGAHLPQGVTSLLRTALEPQGIEVIATNPAVTVQSLKAELMEHNVHCVVGAPSQLLVLAELLENDEYIFEITEHLRKHSQRLALHSILSSGEHVPPSLENAFKRLNLLHLDHYGITEMGYSAGVECPAKNGYHLRELDVYIEILAIDSDTPVADGTLGEIVVTTLLREAMPLIRYRTGDAARFITSPCPCTSPLRRLSPIAGRINRQGTNYNIIHCHKGNLHERTTHATL